MKESEIKVLDVDVKKLSARLSAIGAKKVYDDVRVITTWDAPGGLYAKQDKLIRITEEDGAKLTMHINNSNPKTKQEIKFKTARSAEPTAFMKGMGLARITKVRARRVSFELGKIDFDIDKFPKIPAFLEIDVAGLPGSKIKSLLADLGLSKNKVVANGTEAIHKLYGVDYFKAYGK
ncbi:MAG: hypothetical protein LBG89_04035 [Rickettsiales bacterium]|jgi:predicted adenylyl cyclase CyaB|nr:hypothetical protein [Rickettsiales bacterium]